MKTILVIQARLGSSRLPGKVLKPLGDGTVLSEMLRRAGAMRSVDEICVAVPDAAADDPVALEARRCGASVARGSEHDVLERYRDAARQTAAHVVMRVTSDCPLVDPALCDEVAALRERERADYAANNMPPGYPHGLDCEVFTVEALEQAAARARDPYEREHVTPWIRREPALRRVNLAGPGADTLAQRWTLDFPEDYAFLTALWRLLPAPPAVVSWRDVLALLARHPEISALNASRRVARS